MRQCRETKSQNMCGVRDKAGRLKCIYPRLDRTVSIVSRLALGVKLYGARVPCSVRGMLIEIEHVASIGSSRLSSLLWCTSPNSRKSKNLCKDLRN